MDLGETIGESVGIARLWQQLAQIQFLLKDHNKKDANKKQTGQTLKIGPKKSEKVKKKKVSKGKKNGEKKGMKKTKRIKKKKKGD